MTARRVTSLRMGLAIAASVMILGGAAGADHGCNGSVTEIDVPKGIFYVDDRGGGNVWAYRESNGQPGLQSGGPSVILGGLGADWCAHPNPDTLIA